jgi:glucosamine-6-phosphate deaminase
VAVEVVVVASPAEVCLRAAQIIDGALRACPETVLGLPTGNTPRALYAELGHLHREAGLSFARASAFALDEYVGIAPAHPGAFRRYLNETLYLEIDLPAERAHFPDAQSADLPAACARYEAEIAAAGGIDLLILGLGGDGHIAFNEPRSSFASRTRVETLTAGTRAANRAAFDPEAVPRRAVTIGIGTILEARRCLLLAFGPDKATAVAEMVEGPPSERLPASALQLHPHATVLIDGAAAAGLRQRPA